MSKPKISPEEEHRALEEAMKELSTQTDALLSQHEKESNQVKPVLPKKRIVPHTNGAHLDIVNHAPSSVTRPAVEHVSAPELLEARATKSFNETSPEKNIEQRTEAKVQAGVTLPTQLHTAKKIEPPVQIEKPALRQSDSPHGSNIEPEKVHFEQQPKLADTIATVDEEEVTDEADNEQSAQDEVAKKPLHAEAHEFDAELKLQDWSKLAKPSRLPWVLFLLLVLLILGLGYVYTTGTINQFLG